ncbi:hypothetical protein HO173_011152 [Letharia columbiana]|uniref:CFEM domain-containing protein n=1 Tax=Letharia columbiana TaxID=112416 RepID=A0A8H6FLC5_9LECA|nr:uncharacterized protein HO173_011152 [Letharia columbiana]KAF6230615.1 hypothetical protein HO173_011152 [Letharia columbiana]
MKCLFLLHTLLAASLVGAQSVADLPSCSLPCFSTAIATTNCGDTDYVCQCTAAHAATIRSSVTACLAKSTCSLGDLEKIQTWSNTFCPSVLSSASAASASSTSSTSSSTSASPSSTTSDRSGSTSSAVPVVIASSTSASASSTSSVSPAVETFGAGTHGTTWGNLPANPSNANRGPAFEAVSIILLSVAALVLAFRFFARIYTKRVRQVVRGVGPDEWFALMTLIITAGVTADIIVGTEYGMGKHMSLNETSAQLSAILKLVYVFILLITVSFGSMKFSVLFLYLRMTPERSHKIAIYIIMGFVVAHEISSLVGAIFQCVPIDAFWAAENPLQNSKCIGILVFNGFNSAWSSLEDLVIWILPIPVIWKLKVPFSRKMGLWVLIAISFISVVCAIVRMASLIIWMRSIDISWNYPLVPFLSNMEVCVGLMTSSVPAIYPLFRRSARKQSHSDPAPPPMGPPETSWVSRDSHDETAVPSTADRSSKRWSFLSRKTSTKPKLDGHGYLSTMRSEYGPRTELRSVFETDEVGDFIPGLAK